MIYQTAYEGKIFQLKLFCGKDYPESPPNVRFQTRINMACVNPENGVVSWKNNIVVIRKSCYCKIFSYIHSFACFFKQAGSNRNDQVEPSHFPMLSNWRREYTMEDLLIQLKKEMMSPQNRKLAQPVEGNFLT